MNFLLTFTLIKDVFLVKQGNENEEADIEQEPKEEEVAIVRTRSPGTGKILLKAWRKFITNPNTYATLFGLVWATLHFR